MSIGSFRFVCDRGQRHDQPVVLWVSREDWAILSDRKQGAQVRWKEILAEKLPRSLAALAIPQGFEEEDCQSRPAPGGAVIEPA